MAMMDMTGKPRSDEDLQDAIDCITVIAVKHPLVLPMLTVNVCNIRDCLAELQVRRLREKIGDTNRRAPRVLNKRVDVIPPDAILVDRTTKWGNPFRVGRDAKGKDWSNEDVVHLYRAWLIANEQDGLMKDLHELTGHDLVCWDAPLPCHADVLLELANA